MSIRSSSPAPEFSNLTDWKDKVLARDGGSCVNCNSQEKTVACFIVPSEVGGNLRLSNGVTICRECRILAESSRVLPQRIDNKTPINFLISEKLHKLVNDYVHHGSNFGSVSALVRSMITSFITQPELYEDLQNWQDRGAEIKLNGWTNGIQYDVFRGMCRDRGISYTDALKGLLLVATDGYEPK